jgi:lactoylglutathione lyase
MVEFILYVKDQKAARDFYSNVLQLQPVLNVPGMTEFLLAPGCKLGLMPATGIAKIICPALPHPSEGAGIPRCELYLYTDNPAGMLERALAAGGTAISPLQPRDWGDEVGYCGDLDGHVLAVARRPE